MDVDHLDRLLGEEGTRVWLDLESPDEAELGLLKDEFGLHPLAIEDASKGGQRAKVEPYEDHVFLVLHALRLEEDARLSSSEVHAFAGHRFLITIRFAPVLDLAPIIERWDRQPELTSEGAGFLLYALLDVVVDGYFDVVDRLDDLADELEDRVFAEEPDPEVQGTIFRLKRQVAEVRRLVTPMRRVPDLLLEEPGLVTPLLAPYYRDVADHVVRVLESIDTIRELLTSALEAQLSQVSNRLNVVMKKLTAWAGIVLVPTLIAGIYGMNFTDMPELRWQLGYPFALGIMAASALALYVVFKRRDWL